MGYSDFLFAQPSFLGGLGSVLDLTGLPNAYNTSPTEADADHVALWLDWAAIGADMKAATRQFALDHQEELARVGTGEQ